MKIDYLIFYLYRLIKDGHEWQYKNLNGRGESPKSYFSFLQIIAIIIGIIFVIFEPEGLSQNATDNILGCLSIMVALFLSLILVAFDKSETIKFSQDRKDLHYWNFFYQFHALTSYAILLSILVIVLIIVGLVFDIRADLSDYYFISFSLWDEKSVVLFIKCFIICCLRLSVVYFLLDFFIICLYAICAIYQFIRLDFIKKRPKIEVYREESIDIAFKREYGFSIKKVKYIIYLFLLLISIYVIYITINLIMGKC